MSENERVAYLLKSYGLDTSQGVYADALMNGPTKDWPERLRDIVSLAQRRYGISGDVIEECIVDFIKGVTLDEFAAKHDAARNEER